MPAAGDNIEAVRKTLRLMEILSVHNGELTVTQLASMLDCSVSSANRFLQTLLHAGYVEKNPNTNRYMLTYRLYTLGHQLIEHNYMVQAMIPIAHTISQKYDISVNINGFSGKEPLLLFRVTRFYNKDLDFLSGQSAPAYCTSSGKAILSQFTPEQLAAYFDGISFTAYQGKMITEAALREELDQARRAGYATCSEEYVSGIFSLSFPVRDKNRSLYAFTLITTMRNRQRIMRPEVLSEIKKRLAALM